MTSKLYFVFIFLYGVVAGYDVSNKRSKRYLVYPDGGPARSQFIIGLGIPVDLKDQAVTVGTVIKFQYILPSNSTDYTSRIFGSAQTVSRGMDNSNSIHESDGRFGVGIKNGTVKESGEEDVLVDIDFDKEGVRRRRAYDNGVIKYDDDNLTLEEAIRKQELIDEEKNEEEELRKANRWDYYKVIEKMIERYGFSGRACLLRTICEAAEVPFTHQSGLLAEIGHVLFTPSTTTDELTHHTDNEYHAAERLGRDLGFDCETVFPECEISILDTFTQIGFNTLHNFGIY